MGLRHRTITAPFYTRAVDTTGQHHLAAETFYDSFWYMIVRRQSAREGNFSSGGNCDLLDRLYPASHESSVPVGAHKFPFAYRYHRLGEVHSTVMIDQERHSSDGVLTGLAHHKDLFKLHVSHLNGNLHNAIKWELTAIRHLSMSIASHELILYVLG